MDDASRAGIAGLPDRLDEIEHHISRLANMRREGGERTRSLKGISAMVKALARDVDNADERARPWSRLRARTTGFAERAEISRAACDQRARPAHAEMRNHTAPPPVTENRPPKLDEIRRRLNTLLAQTEAPAPAKAPAAPQAAVIDAALRALEDRIDDAKARFESRMAAQAAEPSPVATAGQIERVEQRLEEISARLAQSEAERRKPKKKPNWLRRSVRFRPTSAPSTTAPRRSPCGATRRRCRQQWRRSAPISAASPIRSRRSAGSASSSTAPSSKLPSGSIRLPPSSRWTGACSPRSAAISKPCAGWSREPPANPRLARSKRATTALPPSSTIFSA